MPTADGGAQPGRDHPLGRARVGVAPGAPALDRRLLELGVPVLGICYGMQLLVHELGGRVEQAEVGEFGDPTCTSRSTACCSRGLPEEQTCWMSHRDTVVRAAAGLPGARLIERLAVAAVEDAAAASTASSFTPRSCTPPTASRSSRAFLADVCGCERTWSAAVGRRGADQAHPRAGGKGRVICGLSGGVDSSVAALLVHRAVGDQLTCVFVDHGLMRKDEGDQVVSTFRDTFKVPLVAVDAAAALPGAAALEWSSPRPSARRSARNSSACSRRRREARRLRRTARCASSCRARSTRT